MSVRSRWCFVGWVGRRGLRAPCHATEEAPVLHLLCCVRWSWGQVFNIGITFTRGAGTEILRGKHQRSFEEFQVFHAKVRVWGLVPCGARQAGFRGRGTVPFLVCATLGG
jgi:hypothetical protein